MSTKEFIEKYGIEEAKKSLAILENGGEKDEFYMELYELVNSDEIHSLFVDSFNPEKQTELMNKMFENKKDWLNIECVGIDSEKLK